MLIPLRYFMIKTETGFAFVNLAKTFEANQALCRGETGMKLHTASITRSVVRGIVGSVTAGLVGVPLALAIATPSRAQDLELEEIIVTAQKRAQNLQDVPAAVSALTEDMLLDIGGADLKDFTRSIPGIEMQSDRAGENRITIRGVSVQTGTAPPVGVYIDEIPVSTFAGEQINLKTFDVERLEVLRGPQGTLYGEGNLGGTVRIVTNKPDPSTFAGSIQAIASDTHRGGSNSDLSGMLNIPIADGKAALRLTGIYKDYEGWIDNPAIAAEKINSDEGHTIRAALRLQPTERLTIDASYIDQQLEVGGAPAGDADYNTFAGSPEPREDDLSLASLTIDYDFDWATLVSATGFLERNAFSNNDFTPIAPLLSALFMTPVDVAFITRPNDQEIFTQEVRLVSAGDRRLSWTVGAFYKDNNIVIANSSITEPAVPAEVFELLVDETIEQKAVFGQIEYDFTDRWHGLLGLRYFEEDRDIVSNVSGLLPLVLSGVPAGVIPESSSEDVVTPKVSLAFDLNDDVMFYVLASNGFRAGGINPQAFLFPGAPTSYGSESLWNYEFGAKTRWLNGRMIVNGAVYRIEWDDVIIDAFTGDPLFAFSVNGGKAHSTGVELEVIARPTERLDLRFAGNYTDSELDETFDIGTTPLTAVAGARLPLVPEYKLNVAAQYTAPISGRLSAMARVDLSRIDETESTILNTPELVNDAYSTLNARIGVFGETWELFAFGDNLTDERGELFTAAGGESTLITPRTIGLVLRLHF